MKPFSINEQSLGSHFNGVEAVLAASACERGVRLSLETNGDGVAFGLADLPPCETVERNRGGEAAVAPLLDLRGGLHAWIGYQERWSVQSRREDKPSFAFRSSSLTVHFGKAGVILKPQMFRAEWAGLVLAGKDWAHDAGSAGHPHWQFDALESSGDGDTREYARELRANLSLPLEPPSESDAVKEFEPQIELKEDDIAVLASNRKLSAIHFASSAHWWDRDSQHAHYPKSSEHVRSWLVQTLRYVKSELSRV